MSFTIRLFFKNLLPRLCLSHVFQCTAAISPSLNVLASDVRYGDIFDISDGGMECTIYSTRAMVNLLPICCVPITLGSRNSPSSYGAKI